MDKKILAIINPASAGGRTAKIWPQQRSYFQQEFSSLDEIYTQKAGEAVNIAAKAVEKGYDYLLAVGGDGTVNEIANGMLKTGPKNLETKLVVYAQGTGSDLSRSLKLPTDIKEFIALIKRGKSRNLKLIKAEFNGPSGDRKKRYFLNIADCGMGAEVAKNLNQSRKVIDGSLSYLLSILKTLFIYQNKAAELKVDGKLIYTGSLNTAIIANGNYFGGGIKIAPAADLFSDKLNLILLKDISKIAIILNLIKAYQGSHLKHPLVESYLAEEVSISAAQSLELELDGESMGKTDVKFKAAEQKIAVIS